MKALFKMKISNVTLMKIAAIGGFATVSMGFAARLKIMEAISKTEHYKDALKTLRAHPGAVLLLGEPIKEGNIDIDDIEKNFTKALTSQYEVPVKGPKQKGILYFWAERPSEEDNWVVNRIELELKNVPDKKLLIKGTKTTS